MIECVEAEGLTLCVRSEIDFVAEAVDDWDESFDQVGNGWKNAENVKN